MTARPNNARLKVTHAGPYVSFQDAGRPGNLRYGIPQSGPMDRLSHAAANSALGQPASATGIEISRGGMTFECVEGSVTIAVTGGDFTESWNARTISVGDRVTIQARSWGSWAYLAVLGTFQAPQWMGQTATHWRSGFGGGKLTTGQEIAITNPATDQLHEGEIPVPELAQPTGLAHVVLGPQDHLFSADTLAAFTESQYTLTDAYDRMGVRLSGTELPPGQGALSIPSEPVVRGSVQVAGDLVPTVLLADHQTTGGYPKIATVLSTDTDQLTQLRSGDNIRFKPVTVEEAVQRARSHAAEIADYLEEIRKPQRTLAHRLMAENLIGTLPSLDS